MAMVFISANSGEEYLKVEGHTGDRNDLDPWHNGNELVAAVAEVNPNVVVVVHSTGPIILESILSHASVKAIVWAGLPGQESGNALVDILYGSTSPNGKLPFTIAKRPSDYGVEFVTDISPNGVDDFKEGLYIDYRHFDKQNITPRYEFGYGLCESFPCFSQALPKANLPSVYHLQIRRPENHLAHKQHLLTHVRRSTHDHSTQVRCSTYDRSTHVLIFLSRPTIRT